ncbi:MAG: hypothetical protein EZS28_006756 [Streblomastix strix]|uniref:Uncharacterized protein n=1 Tax=Streblomastix strix TaxID=222440 RepID=A0A5J4WRG6_9EUKA|nr:MAG: hypothetical protein EZS28_006756 [Streblomastix strix]
MNLFSQSSPSKRDTIEAQGRLEPPELPLLSYNQQSQFEKQNVDYMAELDSAQYRSQFESDDFDDDSTESPPDAPFNAEEADYLPGDNEDVDQLLENPVEKLPCPLCYKAYLTREDIDKSIASLFIHSENEQSHSLTAFECNLCSLRFVMPSCTNHQLMNALKNAEEMHHSQNQYCKSCLSYIIGSKQETPIPITAPSSPFSSSSSPFNASRSQSPTVTPLIGQCNQCHFIVTIPPL